MNPFGKFLLCLFSKFIWLSFCNSNLCFYI